MMVRKMPVELDYEIALGRLAQSGSTEAFEMLVNRYEGRIFRLVRAVTKNNRDAEDAFEETFVNAYANIRRFKGESRFYTWLVSIAINETVAKLYLRQVHTWVSSDDAESAGEVMSLPRDIRDWRHNPEEGYSKPELFAILSKALEDLETPMRIIFTLRDIDGLSPEETARVLGLPLASVTTLLTRARLKLRQNLSAWFENPSVPASGQGECESVRYFLGPALAEDRECT
jgi:RNA polymerase sigma-70 factor, ECF subfamily